MELVQLVSSIGGAGTGNTSKLDISELNIPEIITNSNPLVWLETHVAIISARCMPICTGIYPPPLDLPQLKSFA